MIKSRRMRWAGHLAHGGEEDIGWKFKRERSTGKTKK
jgi:hypothetical protein